jgi:hypothetical protein
LTGFEKVKLAAMSGLEEASFIQTWILELTKPRLSVIELIDASPEHIAQIVSIGDCDDAFELLFNPGTPTPVNRSMTLYVQACREFYELRKLEGFVWIDTRDNIANCLTKFSQTGYLELEGLRSFYTTASWEPTIPYKWHSDMLTDPSTFERRKFRDPEPPTKVLQDKLSKPENEQYGSSTQ